MDISFFLFNYYFKGTSQTQKMVEKKIKKGTIEESDKTNERKKKKNNKLIKTKERKRKKSEIKQKNPKQHECA